MNTDPNAILFMAAKAVLGDSSGATTFITALAGHKSPAIRAFIASEVTSADPDAEAILRHLAKDGNAKVRSGVASNQATPPDILSDLSRDQVREVARIAAGNPRISAETLALLATKATGALLRSIASNPANYGETLAELVVSNGKAVRDLIALNPATPTEVRARLLPQRNKRWAKELKSLADDGKEHEFVALLARRLLWYQLAYCGALGELILVNENRHSDTVHLEFPVRTNSGIATWEVSLTDFENQNSALDVGIFRNGLIDTWPDNLDWPEFAYGRVLPTPKDPGYDYEFERLCSESWPSDWPSLLADTGYLHWAFVDLASHGWLPPDYLMSFLRELGAPYSGRVELRAQGAVSAEEDSAIPCEASVVVAVLSRLRAGRVDSDDVDFVQAATIARDLIEPLLVITPNIPSEITDFVTLDPQCPAMRLVKINADVADEVRALATLVEGGPLALGSNLHEDIGPTAASEWRPEESGQPNDELVHGSSPTEQERRSTLAKLLVDILTVVPEPNEHAEDGEVEASVGRHKQYLQASMWLLGDVWVSVEMLDGWINALTEFSEAVSDEESDPEFVEELAFNSWAIAH